MNNRSLWDSRTQGLWSLLLPNTQDEEHIAFLIKTWNGTLTGKRTNLPWPSDSLFRVIAKNKNAPGMKKGYKAMDFPSPARILKVEKVMMSH